VPLPASRDARPRAARRRDASSGGVAAAWIPPACFAAALLVYLFLRHAALESTFGAADALHAHVAPAVIGAVGLYLSKLVLPLHQSAYISELPTSAAALAATDVAVVGLSVATAYAWRRQARAVAYLLVWIGATLAPSLAIVVKIPTAPVAERYLYLPSIGFCLLAGYAAARALLASRGALRAAVLTVVAVVLCLAASAAVGRNAVWRSNLTLWSDTAAKNTTEGLPMRGLATAYQESGDPQKAAEYFQRALQRHNDPAGLFTINNNLGTLAMTAKRYDEAERYYRQALAADPNAADSLFNLGLIALTRAREGEPGHDASWQHEQAEQARRTFEQAQRLSPLDPDIAVALGQTLMTLDDKPAARAQLEHALQMGLPPATDAAVRQLLAGNQ